ncbi:MAG: DUF4292 domain-containing protein [Flavobacteriaceae bacterium]|nr:DUF4292 domain-containing protein [Flavobacteriaceae bacterium]
MVYSINQRLLCDAAVTRHGLGDGDAIEQFDVHASLGLIRIYVVVKIELNGINPHFRIFAGGKDTLGLVQGFGVSLDEDAISNAIVDEVGVNRSLIESSLSSTAPNPKWTAGQVIRAHKQTRPEFAYYAARTQLVYESKGQRQKVNLSLRMKYGDTIWMKASVFGVTLAKALITKDKVSYYESLNKTYYEGPTSEIARWIGIPVSMTQLQNILLGQSIMTMGRNADMSIRNNQYVLGPLDTGIGWNIHNSIRPDNFRLERAELGSTGVVPTSVELTYSNYAEVAKQLFPEQLNLSVRLPGQTTAIELNFKQIDLLDRLNFSYQIPKGFKAINP